LLTDLQTAEKRLTRCLTQLTDCKTIDTLMGREGEAAQVYFGVFNHLIRQADFEFDTRRRRPPTDPINALLSFCYTLLTHDCRSALETTGLDPASGFLHQLRSGRPSLALDMAEEFRPMIDRFVLSLINKRQLISKDFETWPNGSVTLKDEPRKTLLAAWQDRKQDTLLHPWFEETVPIGLLPWLQAQVLARFLRGDCDSYVPFLWKWYGRFKMMILVTYDVSFKSETGPKRLRRMAKLCLVYGQRVQYSVFEIEVDMAQWTKLKNDLIGVMDESLDSLRFYYLGNNWERRVEHIGAKAVLDLNGLLLL
jgi:CRISPR-associated endonuclease Cas2